MNGVANLQTGEVILHGSEALGHSPVGGTSFVGSHGTKTLIPVEEVKLAPTHGKADESSKASQWALHALNGRHKDIMRRLIEGANLVDVAKHMGVSLDALTIIVNSPLFRAELKKQLEQASREVSARLENLAGEALDYIRQMMRETASEMTRRSCADSILDRAGYGRTEKKQLFVIGGEEVIKELNRRRAEAAFAGARDVTGAEEESAEGKSA